MGALITSFSPGVIVNSTKQINLQEFSWVKRILYKSFYIVVCLDLNIFILFFLDLIFLFLFLGQ